MRFFNHEDVKELRRLDSENIGEGTWTLWPEPKGFRYIPSHRERVLENIACRTEIELTLRSKGLSDYETGTTFMLVRDMDTGEDYYYHMDPGDRFYPDQMLRFGPFNSLIELFDAIIDEEIQESW